MFISNLAEARTWLESIEPWRDCDDVAIITDEHAVTGRSLMLLADRAAHWIDSLGFDGAPGMDGALPALLTSSANSLALAIAGCATSRPIAALAPRHTARELIACVERLPSPVLITEPSFATTAEEVCAATGKRLVVVPEQLPEDARELSLDVVPDSLVIVLHTSGTTGIPKSVPIRQDRFVARCRLNAATLGFGPGDRYATASPFYHIAGFGSAGVSLAAGATLVSVERFTIDVWRSLRKRGLTGAMLVPTMISMLLDAGELHMPGLKMLQYGAAPMPHELLRSAMAQLPGVDFVTIYGQTEGTPLTALTARDHVEAAAGHPEVLASVGHPAPGLELQIHDPDADGIGELWARAEHLFCPSDDGWLHTGDLGRVDADGFVFLVGRKGDMIIRGGENIYPAEVESVLDRHPGVRECAVVAIPDDRWGEIVGAFIVPTDPADPPDVDDLRAHCRKDLAGFKVPTQWHMIDELPRNPTGKILRRELVPR